MEVYDLIESLQAMADKYGDCEVIFIDESGQSYENFEGAGFLEDTA